MSSKMLSLTSTIGASLPLSLRPKKKLHFDVTFTLQELINCTFVTGVLFAKIQLKDGGSFNGTSHRNDVENHRVQWDQDFNFSCKMYANADGVLEPCWCKVSIRKETKGGRSCKKLGYVKLNLAEYAGAGVRQRKYLLESYNENKHKPDNSLLKVKLYLRQTSGDIVFKAPETRVYEIGEEDEGIQEDWWSLNSRGSQSLTPRASTGSTMSAFSLGASSWSTNSGSAGNLKSQDSLGDVSKSRAERDFDHESGSEETVVEQSSSRVTMKTATSSSTVTSQPRPTDNTAPSQSSTNTSKTPSTILTPPTPTIPSLPVIIDRSESLSEENVDNFRHPSLERPQPQLPQHTGSFRDLRHSPALRKQTQKSIPLPPEISPSSSSRQSKVGPSVQVSHVTALPSNGSHRRLASVGGTTPITPSPLTMGHKRHSSFSTIPKEFPSAETISLNSTKTRATTLSTLEQSRVDTEQLVNQLLAGHDLTSYDEGDSNLKIYVDKHSGGVTLTGHALHGSRFKEIDVHNVEPSPKPKPRQKRKKKSESLLLGSNDSTPSSSPTHIITEVESSSTAMS